MRITDIVKEDGRIVQGINTTIDVKPGETERQAAKFFGHGKPKELHKKARKNSDPNTLYNMGLVEAVVKQSDIIKVISNIAVRSDGKSHPVRFYDGGVLNVKPTTAEKILNLYDRIDDKKKEILDKYLPTYNGFKEIAKKVGAVQEAKDDEYVPHMMYKGTKTDYRAKKPRSKKPHDRLMKRGYNHDDPETKKVEK